MTCILSMGSDPHLMAVRSLLLALDDDGSRVQIVPVNEASHKQYHGGLVMSSCSKLAFFLGADGVTPRLDCGRAP
jgi:hypothetical protein